MQRGVTGLRAGVAGSLCWLLLPGIAYSATWETGASMSAGVIYTDNVRLTEEDEESRAISIVTPQFSIKGQGSRMVVNAVGAVEFNDLGGDADSANPRLLADANLELVEDHFFLDVDADAHQTSVDPFRASGVEAASQTGNTTTVYNYGFSPYFVSRVGELADLKVSYGYDEQRFSGNNRDTIEDSNRHTGNILLESLSGRSRLSWALTADYNKTDYLGENAVFDLDTEQRTAGLQLGYELSRKWQLTGTFGKEWNDFVSLNPSIDDTYWTAGVVWTPTRRTKIDAGYGERFFGNTPYINFSHTARRTVWKLGYSRDVTDNRSLRERQRTGNFLTDEFGQPIDPFTGEPIPIDEYLTTLNSGIRVNERFDSSFSIKGNRSTVTISARQSKQQRQVELSESTFNYAQVKFTRNLSRNLSANMAVSWDERKNSEDNALDSVTYRLRLGLSIEVGPMSSLSAAFTHSDRDAEGTDQFGSHQENRLSVTYLIRFK
ncbi:MAG: TIGR03016 family PEP-CTERM system-associated outer membrane protein [Porticoccaceae bacterium]|nr:TIGR03016 family PEP-CTERM system-associated outer membrane protein [Porticoccaceae bacterium]